MAIIVLIAKSVPQTTHSFLETTFVMPFPLIVSFSQELIFTKLYLHINKYFAKGLIKW